MKSGYLSQYFVGIATKKLSAVEANSYYSHQHEFNGARDLKKIFGEVKGKKIFNARFIYLNDIDDDAVTAEGKLTWYDAREKHPTRSEYRLYFPTTLVSDCAEIDDMLLIGLRPDDSVLIIIAESGSTIENQIKWLFGIDDKSHPGFSIRGELESEQDKIAFASRLILEQIGIEIEDDSTNFLDEMIEKFGGSFPKTKEFSQYARSTIKYFDPIESPDDTLSAWVEREEILFRTLEKHLIAERLKNGFVDTSDVDVEGFIKYSLSIQNRRKSRVGLALENHLEELFMLNGIHYARTPVTENKAKPDFIFPNIEVYKDINYPSLYLTMLGVKSTCKDRWRQVLSEADRIEEKHLLTLEAAISENQTNEMAQRKLKLVLPKKIHTTYSDKQQFWLMSVEEFINLVNERQMYYVRSTL